MDAATIGILLTLMLALAGGLWTLSRIMGRNDATLSSLAEAIDRLERSLTPIVDKLSDHGERLASLESWREDRSR